MNYQIIKAENPEHFREALILFKEYADSLDFTLSFQNFEEELQQLPKMYGAPEGALLLVEHHGKYIGTGGIRKIEGENTCEIKRMFIKHAYQNLGIGKTLMHALINTAKDLQYKTIKLDTLGPKMPAAVKVYRSFGFIETTPYNFNPYEGILYFEKSI
jgi:putative acetyltransferase